MSILLPLLAIAANAQEAPITPKAEVFGTYSYFRLGTGRNYQSAHMTKGFEAAGVFNLNEYVGVVLDMGHHWGRQDLSPGFVLPGGITNVKATLHTLMGGPRFTYRRGNRVIPFANILVGGARIYNGYSPPAPAPAPAPAPTSPSPSPAAPTPTAPTPTTPTPAAPTPTTPDYGGGSTVSTGSAQYGGSTGYVKKTDTVFGWGVGGGFDVKITNRIQYRPFEAEYMMLRPDALTGKGLNNLRISTGIGFSFGSK